MSAINNQATSIATSSENQVIVSPIVSGKDLTIGEGFNANAYRKADFSGLMDPLIMVDHYNMRLPTFGAHPHAGLSAVTLMFEDSTGKLNNKDSLGNDFDLNPGDLYWLKAGSGVVHDEAPVEGSTIHGLQVFVNIPAVQKHSAPASLHVKAQDMPIIENHEHRVRVVLGEHNNVKGAVSPSVPMTILDGDLNPRGSFTSYIPQGHHAWLTAVSGKLSITVDGERIELVAGQAVAIANQANEAITLQLNNPHQQKARFAVFSAQPLNEEIVQKGPLIASSWREMEQVEARLAAGEFGQVETQL